MVGDDNMKSSNTAQSLGVFLKEARTRLTPEAAGLPSIGRRRTPGLRREEVAQLANIGVSWYTAIEQGKAVHPSNEVLHSLATALSLSTAERQYLLSLSNTVETEELDTQQHVPVGLEEIAFSLDPNPVYALDEYWEVLFWNRAAEIVFHFPAYTSNMASKPNMLYHFVTVPHMKVLNPNWEEHVKGMIARYRSDRAKYSLDEKATALIKTLKKESSLFKELWGQEKISLAESSHKRWTHPDIGTIECEYNILQTPDAPNLKLMVFTADGITKEKIQQQIDKH